MRSNCLQTTFKLKCRYSKTIRFVKYPKNVQNILLNVYCLKTASCPACKMHTLKSFKFYKNFILRFARRTSTHFLWRDSLVRISVFLLKFGCGYLGLLCVLASVRLLYKFPGAYLDNVNITRCIFTKHIPIF
jgi:hypothetical protein